MVVVAVGESVFVVALVVANVVSVGVAKGGVGVEQEDEQYYYDWE